MNTENKPPDNRDAKATLADRLKTEFISNVSHELRTPLHAIVGYVDLLREGIYGPLAPEQAQVVGYIHESAIGLLDLVSNLLDLSRLESGRADLVLKKFDLRELVEELFRQFKPLADAKKFMYDTITRGRKVLFVGTKKQAQEPLKKLSESLQQPYVVNRWLGGMLTNNRTIRQSVSRMRKIEGMEKDSSMEKLPKKEQAALRHELSKLQKNLSGIADMESLPGALFVVDIMRDAIAVSEAVRLNIPVVAMVDTNVNPDPIAYPIPANDDAIRSIVVILDEVGRTIKQATDEYAKVAAEHARTRALADAEAKAKAKSAEDERRNREKEARKARSDAIAKAKTVKDEAKPAVAEDTPAVAPEAPAAPATPAEGSAPA